MKPRILVVDDEPALRRTLERALGAMGYDVVSVGDPLLVYELLDAADYDLVILDIHLPQLSGDTLAIACGSTSRLRCRSRPNCATRPAT